MTDWSTDPVFGDVAMELALQHVDLDEHFWPHPPWNVRFRASRRGVERRLAEVPSVRHQLAPERPVDRGRVLWWEVVPIEIEELGGRIPALKCILAAGRAQNRAPGTIRIQGVVNVTPDSFSDGGEHFDAQRAIEHGLALVRDGADLLDVGGESTRPGSEPVDEREELRRVLPVVRGLAERANVPISIDTTKSDVAKECLAAGAAIVNDVSAGRFDERMLDVVARANAGYVAMHMLGTPRDMQTAPRYDDVVGEVMEFLRARCRAALEAGVERSKLWIDPGIGFGKTLDHNKQLLVRLNQLRSLGLPIVLGVSRKSFVATIEEKAGFPRSGASSRLGGTLAALTIGVQNGAEILRVHDVREAKQAALVARALASWNRDA